jgi:thiol-disulfide isomerase/thioredoxin
MPAQAGETKSTPIVGASIGTTQSAAAPAPAVIATTAAPSKPASLAVTKPESYASTTTAPASAPDVMPAMPNWTWNTLDGKTYENVVINKREPDQISITHSKGVAHIPMSLLSDDIKKQLNYDPAAAAAAAARITRLIQGKLVDASGTPVIVPGSDVQYYAVYYSAAWCPPCHLFTPKLVAWYKKFKPNHPNFEVIFVSSDQNQSAMYDYMKDMKMPWPAISYDDIVHDGTGIDKYGNEGIPDLVLVNADGKVLSDSYQGSNYVGPSTVIDDINKLVGGSSPVPMGSDVHLSGAIVARKESK